MVVSILSGLALCVWCGWTSGFHHSTTPAFATWSASLAGVVVVNLLLRRGQRNRPPALHLPSAEKNWPRPGQGGSRRAFIGTSPWLAVALVVLIWEVLGIDTGRHETHLTISTLAQDFRALNAALLLVWILVGIAYGAARARTPVEGASGEPARHVVPEVPSNAVAITTLGHPTVMPALLLPQSRAVGVGFWVCVIIACVLVELTARRSRGRLANGEEFLRLISGPTVAHVLLIVVWGYAGWHLFAH